MVNIERNLFCLSLSAEQGPVKRDEQDYVYKSIWSYVKILIFKNIEKESVPKFKVIHALCRPSLFLFLYIFEYMNGYAGMHFR